MGGLVGGNTEAEETDRIVKLQYDDPNASRHNRQYKNNYVRTAKYTWWNFIFKNLYEQFKKGQNLYFLLIAILQTIDLISISNGKSAMAFPLVIVILVSMIKDAYEDYKRHMNDDKENNSTCQIYDKESKSFHQRRWRDIWCGDIIKLQSDDEIPSDIVVLTTSDEKGNVYIETKNLDGETNLKPKSVNKRLFEYFKRFEGDDAELRDKVRKINGEIQCQPPNNQLYKFDGNISISLDQ